VVRELISDNNTMHNLHDGWKKSNMVVKNSTLLNEKSSIIGNIGFMFNKCFCRKPVLQLNFKFIL